MKQQQNFLSGLKPLGHCTTVLLAERIVLSSATTCAMLQQCRAGVPLFIFLFAPFHLSRCAGGGEEEERGRAGPSRKRERERDPDSFAHLINFAVSAESARYRRLSSRHRLRRRKWFTVHRASFHAGPPCAMHVPSVSRTRFRAFRNFSGLFFLTIFGI